MRNHILKATQQATQQAVGKATGEEYSEVLSEGKWDKIISAGTNATWNNQVLIRTWYSYTEEFEIDGERLQSCRTPDSTVGTAQALLDADSTLSAEIEDLDKLDFDDPLPVVEICDDP